ncbi:hypothetical protein FJV41_19765 [Myxococcus llanfairpwllgwyngyllgogerychwyrndrobwllllantysiliogogogochensis]|uniref:Uncharacterized protein n=1 Tax=Myxococcus llanfairpwllgwyngyllgogerychwyrndrobwllllantysiliogogogochensis TaxID=2590453 RepID=A0A540WYZ6_9BACT|nr:hypothetical protein [Myxococcus llanfairpwllgwyngyllgogerychwyrndrobwllllantysiliogogogochensis]TQF14209.1 hypothetical protein FJV41_19765 [Myxococcus llanfairpwllgwyngyllgogerychwyrndrobwllllantysiliogogogochensis]
MSPMQVLLIDYDLKSEPHTDRSKDYAALEETIRQHSMGTYERGLHSQFFVFSPMPIVNWHGHIRQSPGWRNGDEVTIVQLQPGSASGDIPARVLGWVARSA